MLNEYIVPSQHPVTGDWEEAKWFQKEISGRHFVRFSDGQEFDTSLVFIPSEKSHPQVSIDLSDEAAKEFTETLHADGRKDVVVQVNALDVEETDEATQRAKEAIEKEVFPRLANAEVVVTVIYRHPMQDGYLFSTKKTVKVPHVRKYAESCVQAFIEKFVPEAKPVDFIVIEYYKTTDEVKITTL